MKNYISSRPLNTLQWKGAKGITYQKARTQYGNKIPFSKEFQRRQISHAGSQQGTNWLVVCFNNLCSLRSKRFRRAFRRFEAFFASWTRENWGERKKVREGGGEGRKVSFSRLPSPLPLLPSVLPSPQFLRRQKAKNASNGRKTLRKRLLRRLEFMRNLVQKTAGFWNRIADMKS